MEYLVNLNSVNTSHLNLVGGKNASLGEMIQHLQPKGIKVPGGFATTTDFFKEFISQNNLNKKIEKVISNLNVKNVNSLEKHSKEIRKWILKTPFNNEFKKEVEKAYKELKNVAVAVRSSATSEDLPNASFAGQQESYLNVKGLNNVLIAIKKVFASLFTSRAIAYRKHFNFEVDQISISAGIQPMVRSDKGVSGVMFTADTETGFDKVIVLTASYGLGETIVQGQVNPDEFSISKTLLENKKFPILQRHLGSKAIKLIYANANNKSTKLIKVAEKDQLKFSLTDDDIIFLAKQALIIEQHYKRNMDIEWAKDGVSGELFILQARPETVNSQKLDEHSIDRYTLLEKGNVIVEGQSIGQRIGSGVAKVILNPSQMHDVKEGEILVTDMTDPDWEPIMKRAAAIVTNRGGRTCHAAIIARELGIPAIVGSTNATKQIKTGQGITVSCAEGKTGFVYDKILPFEVRKISVSDMPKLPLKISMNLGNPDKAFACQFIPNHGIGLARLEFIINSMIGIHPNALLNYSSLPGGVKKEVHKKILAYKDPVEFYIEKLREGISIIASAFFPKPVIFRFSDFKSNEYANLIGGKLFEPVEENPMIGYRGASRYIDKNFRAAFELECKAFKRVRDEMGLTNAQLMIPFVRTVSELKEVINLLQQYGLKRGENDLKIIMMCEIPANALLAEQFLKHVDGFSIGSNDLTQLTLGLDRDSSLVSSLFDERNDAVKALLRMAITECKKQGKYIGICGQGPSDYPDFAEFLMKEGIENISLNPDSILETWMLLAKKNINTLENLVEAKMG